MMRAIARWQRWWVRLFLMTIVAVLLLPIPSPLNLR